MLRRLGVLAALLGLAGLSPATAQPASPYRIHIEEVDSSNFPEIELRFQVFLQDINAPPWTPDQTIVIREFVEGEEGAPIDMEPEARICEQKPVLMSVGIDVSGSVAGVMDDIKTGVEQLFDEMAARASAVPDAKKDQGAIFAFASNTKLRYPDLTADPSHTDALADLSDVVKDISGGGASPIWINMNEELERLLRFEPDDKDYRRVLATLTDGQNNQAEEAGSTLLRNAQRGGAQLFNLAYGSPNQDALNTLASASGGAYLPGADSDIPKALVTLLQSVRTTYCIKYTSPNGDKVNEPASVVIRSGFTQDTAAYPLPFVVPEDSKDVTLFFPVSQMTYDMLSQGDPANLPGVKARLELRDKADPPEPWIPASEDHPARPYTTLPVGVAETRWVADADAQRWGFEVPLPEALFSIPTDFVDMNRQIDADEQLLSRVQHYTVKAEYVETTAPDGTARAGREYPSSTRLSVQDRTPPHVDLRLRPQGGREALELRIEEAGVFNQDPGIIARLGLTNAAAHEPGSGDKRARSRFRWVDAEGEVKEGEVNGQMWSRVDPDDVTKTLPGTLPGTLELEGIRVREGQRVEIEVLARDNFGLAGETTHEDDRDVWSYGQTGEQTGDPLHTQIDRNRQAAQPDYLAPPFLPVHPRRDLEERPALAGIAWWVEKNYQDPRPDPYDDLESGASLIFKHSDVEVKRHLEEAGEALPPGGEAYRYLRVRAQDGQGQVTQLRIPLVIGDTTFNPQLVQWDRERLRAQE